MMVPFQDRARVFQAVVAADRAAARHADALSGSLAGHQFVTIRRTSLLEARAAACRGPPPVCHRALLRQPALAPRTTALDRGLLASRRRAQCAAHAAVGSCGGPQEDMQPTWPPEPAVLAEGVRRVAGRAQDGFAQLGHVPGEELRGRVRIQFVDEYGAEEAGVDGGGLFKDFLERLVRPYTTYPIPGVAPNASQRLRRRRPRPLLGVLYGLRSPAPRLRPQTRSSVWRCLHAGGNRRAPGQG